MDKKATCCFTGHRPGKLPWGENENDPRCIELKTRLTGAVKEAYEKGMRHFICGMANGADMYFCETVLELQKNFEDITLEAAIPCEEQAVQWKERDRERYYNLIRQCDFETMVQHHYDRQCMQRRDRYMVDNSSLVIAVYGGVFGGTMYTITYAMRQGLELMMLEI